MSESDPALDDVSDYDLERAHGHVAEALDRIRRAQEAVGQDAIEAHQFDGVGVASDLTGSEAMMSSALMAVEDEAEGRGLMDGDA